MRNIPNYQTAPSPTYDDDDLLVFAAIGQDVVSHNANLRGIGNMPTSRRCKKPDPRGYRKQFSFWLSCGYEWQRDLGEWLMDLKHRRQFAATVRNALALYRSLQEGRADLLLEWFPWIRDCFTQPPSDVDDLKREIELLKRLMLQQPPAGQGGPKPLATIAAPPPDDDDALVVTVDQDAGARSAENFIKSAFALNGMTFDP